MKSGKDAVPNRIESLHVEGFRSLADVRIANMPNPAVLLGANGSGKSNVLRFFEMVTSMLQERRLAHFVLSHGGADDQLFQGSATTSRIDASVGLQTEAGYHEYRFGLEHAQPDRLLFSGEALGFGDDAASMVWHRFGGGHDEARLPYSGASVDGACESAAKRFKGFFERCVVHQFHDTSATSRFKVRWDAEESLRLLPHGGNLPSVLLHLSRHEKERFDAVCYYVGRILPGFRSFEIEEAYGKTFLRWASGSRKTFGPHLTSDGTLRFFALVTLLNLPTEVLPNIVLLDEPELGLHASAITLIAEMVQSIARERQVVVATQSPIFVDFFGPDELVVLDLDDGQTLVRRPAELDLREWLKEYTTGEIWRKNLIGGRP